MKKILAYLSTFLFAYIFWVLFLMQDFNILNLGIQELVAGVVVSIIVSLFTTKFLIKKDGLFIFKKLRIVRLIMFIPMYLLELIKANIAVAIMALSAKPEISPGIVKIKTELKSDWGLAMLANAITLTPGTITIDVFDEESETVMYVHWIKATTENIEEASDIVKGKFEKRIRGIFE